MGGGYEPYSIIGRAEQRAVAGDCKAREGLVFLGDDIVGAGILSQIPDSHCPTPVTTDDLSLVRVDHDIINRRGVVIAPLYGPRPGFPYLHGAVLRRGYHPLALAVEGHAGDIALVALEGEDGVGVRRLDVVELDGVVAGGGEVALVGRDAEAVDLRLGVLDGARADAREGLPEPGG